MAAKITTVEGTIAAVTRAGISRSNNPTYRIRLTDGREYLTATDAAVGYAATNYEPDSREDGSRVNTLHIRSGRIVSISGPNSGDARR